MSAAENEDLIGQKVTLVPEAITKRDWASIGVTEDTEFTIVAVSDSGVSFSSVKITLHDENGEEYIASAGDLMFI